MLVEQKKQTLHRHDRTRNCLDVVRFSVMCRDRGQIIVSEISNLQLSRNIGLMKATFRCTRLFCHPLRKTDNSVWRNLTCRVKLKRISILKHPDKEIILSLEKMF